VSEDDPPHDARSSAAAIVAGVRRRITPQRYRWSPVSLRSELP
jgi:hypothetical protein